MCTPPPTEESDDIYIVDHEGKVVKPTDPQGDWEDLLEELGEDLK